MPCLWGLWQRKPGMYLVFLTPDVAGSPLISHLWVPSHFRLIRTDSPCQRGPCTWHRMRRARRYGGLGWRLGMTGVWIEDTGA